MRDCCEIVNSVSAPLLSTLQPFQHRAALCVFLWGEQIAPQLQKGGRGSGGTNPGRPAESLDWFLT